jgi:MFS family permease
MAAGSVRPSYRSVLLGASFVQLAVAYTAWYSFTVFLVALVDQFGWNHAETALAQSLLIVVSGLGGPAAGALVDRFGPRPPILAGAVLLGGGVALCSQMHETWQFYLLYGVIGGVGIAACGWVTTTAVLVSWFPRQRASALGVASSGIGVGIMLFVPLTQLVVTAYGWRTAYLLLGASIAVLVTLVALVMRMPDTARARAASARPIGADDPLVVDRGWASTVWSVGRAIRTGRFWLVAGCFFFGTFGTQQILIHQVAILADAGFDRLLAAVTVGVVGICSVVAKLSWGYLSDRFGRELAYSLGMGLIVLSVIVLSLIRVWTVTQLAFTFAALIGFGYAVTAVLSPATVADCFQGRHFGAVFGVVTMGHGIGGAIGAWTTGFLRDTTGSYTTSMLLAASACVLAAILCWLAAPRKVRLVPGMAARRRPVAVG